MDRIYNTNTKLQQEFVRLKPKHEHEREATLLSLVSRTFKVKRTLPTLHSLSTHSLLTRAIRTLLATSPYPYPYP